MSDHRLSKFLSLVLRHAPEQAGITLDVNGWTDVKILLSKLKSKGHVCDFSDLENLVANNDKKRFAFNDTKTKIRANQGHSIEVDLKLEEIEPPRFLYHGTVSYSIDTIKREGLNKMLRHHVHLSENKETAIKVGSRRGNPHILKISSGIMYENGFKFYKSANDVWLTDNVPVIYINFSYN